MGPGGRQPLRPCGHARGVQRRSRAPPKSTGTPQSPWRSQLPGGCTGGPAPRICSFCVAVAVLWLMFVDVICLCFSVLYVSSCLFCCVVCFVLAQDIPCFCCFKMVWDFRGDLRRALKRLPHPPRRSQGFPTGSWQARTAETMRITLGRRSQKHHMGPPHLTLESFMFVYLLMSAQRGPGF